MTPQTTWITPPNQVLEELFGEKLFGPYQFAFHCRVNFGLSTIALCIVVILCRAKVGSILNHGIIDYPTLTPTKYILFPRIA